MTTATIHKINHFQSRATKAQTAERPLEGFKGMSDRDADQVLVEQAQQGNQRAFDVLISKYQHRVVGLARRFVKDDELAQDVAQDVFVKVYKALPRFRGDSAFYTWMYRITVNTAKNYLTAQSRRPPQQDVAVEDAERYVAGDALRELGSPEERLHAEELEKVLMATLEDLPEELRVAITLREFDGLSYEEISQVMACPIGTVRSRIFRAREALDKCISALREGKVEGAR
jgi:RNA polymerase sigma-70 factor (ECF subfamily)